MDLNNIIETKGFVLEIFVHIKNNMNYLLTPFTLVPS